MLLLKLKYFSIHTNVPWFNSTLGQLKHNFRKYNRNYTLNPTPHKLTLTTIKNLPTDVLFNNFANYFIDKIYDKLTIKKTKLINLTKQKYMTTNAVLSTFDLQTITEIYNLIVTA